MSPKSRRSLELTAEEWQHLDELAVEFETTAAAGPNAYMPSWRVLIAAIAAGSLVVSRPSK